MLEMERLTGEALARAVAVEVMGYEEFGADREAPGWSGHFLIDPAMGFGIPFEDFRPENDPEIMIQLLEILEEHGWDYELSNETFVCWKPPLVQYSPTTIATHALVIAQVAVAAIRRQRAKEA